MGLHIQGWLDTFSSIEFEYKGKRYRIWKIKEEQRVIPIGVKHNNDEETERKKITVKDYNVGKWNITVNINGETIIVGWGSVKNLTFWGSIVFLLIIIAYYLIHRLRKFTEERVKKN